jgi:hypothetical protein
MNKRGKLMVHNRGKTCGRCMLDIYEDEEYTIIKSHHGLSQEWFHTHQETCIQALRHEDAIVRPSVR